MVEGGSEKAFAQWLAERPQSFCEKVEAVAMDAFAGYKKAAARQVPHAVEILDPFHIVKLAGDKVTAVRCRLQRVFCFNVCSTGSAVFFRSVG